MEKQSEVVDVDEKKNESNCESKLKKQMKNVEQVLFMGNLVQWHEVK